MMELVLTWSPVAVTVVFAIVALWCLRAEKRARQRLENKLQAMETVLKSARQRHDSLAKQFNELRAGSMGMGQKLADLSASVDELLEKHVELEMQDSESRLYSRASKMVDLGADVDELMQECDLPKAEAELLLNLRKRQAANQQR
ncbi:MULTISPECIES: DUF2802 domain-containing protein [Salinivibrio]|uniref:DNA repair protein n=2 Tax=Salinivibrio kushneri TaxID=1908198 RepID=A0AB36JW64_9GAMM|nr:MULTISPECIES: DUF2802 domain-containing protein [Salinivibrio]ODP99693.1 DNA repair protein [Salinivibrio sp. BNH]OOE36824.1 DNA repair protein [Salinivibrio kushneri]OOE37291.1 DNA repair protein [Salinivibrio kushneri]OOE39411.1 DNA repair protein [Salinivibrio kushneri]OOE46210.1 DNA repair protein [Salinivibrio kushneri]